MITIKAWWKSSTGKDIPKGWDSSKEECLDFITRDSYATGFNKAKELYIEKAKRAFCKAYECVLYDECHCSDPTCNTLRFFNEALEE